uniref:(northern house mosquito) hypothetical protein n=1 Tax=Culex pipiens TaxID=7175 RepID=A0A8D8CKJ5_CULPI
MAAPLNASCTFSPFANARTAGGLATVLKNALASGGAEFAGVATEKRIAESRITAPTAKVSTGPRVRTAQNDEGDKGSWIPCGRSRSDTRKRKKQLSLKRQMGLRDWKRKETKATFRTPPCK